MLTDALSGPVPERRVAAFRRFARFFTRRIGVLTDAFLDSPFSLTEARVLYELAHREAPTATLIGRDLGVDPGYLSRILAGFSRRGLIARRRSPRDGRETLIELTLAGRLAFARLDERSQREVAALVGRLPEPEQNRLVAAMRAIEHLLERERPVTPCSLRPPEPGDMGWVIARHGALYAQEFGWDASFEIMVAGLVAGIMERFDPARERCWIADRDGEPVGSVFVVRHSDEVARLRMLIVDPSARGLGIGDLLVTEAVGFAQDAGYRRMSLWTNSILLGARRLYERHGFERTGEEPHRSFGRDLIGETWERAL